MSMKQSYHYFIADTTHKNKKERVETPGSRCNGGLKEFFRVTTSGVNIYILVGHWRQTMVKWRSLEDKTRVTP